MTIMQKNQALGLRLWNKFSGSAYGQISAATAFVFLLWFWFCLPNPLFQTEHSTVVFSDEGHLLGAKIAPDGQWRFPKQEVRSEKFKKAIIHFEDEYFYYHFGFNPISIAHAMYDNMQSGTIRRGGSTITQQTVRLFRNNPKRTYFEKVQEIILAIRLELSFSKQEILSLYSSYAPFGGNVVGVEAAAWRYFGRSADDLSWAEAASLAVLPNSPSIIHPSKNRNLLQAKRDRLLQKLYQNGVLDEESLQLALAEPLPQEVLPLPRVAPHFVEYMDAIKPSLITTSTIDYNLQLATNRIVHTHYQLFKQNQVHNAAAIIIDVQTKEVKAYVGNTATSSSNENQVDMVRANRSTGSLLKPFLYAAALDAGIILPKTLLSDVPTYYHNYAPKNFNLSYSGVKPANECIVESLNIPAVLLLDDVGIPKFHQQLQQMQLSGVKHAPTYYGLPLILGGAESSLWDLSKAYAGLASTLNHYQETGKYFHNEFSNLNVTKSTTILQPKRQFEVYSAASIWNTFQVITELERPTHSNGWKYFDSTRKIAWKTGTSYGNKDAWAIGATPNYVVGIWVGNADGEGRAGTTGIQLAAPILFDVFKLLPNAEQSWFDPPFEELYEVQTCVDSGQLFGPNCEEKATEWLPKISLETPACQYHKVIALSVDEQQQVNYSCVNDGESVVLKSWFVLPPKQEVYYALQHPMYQQLPPVAEQCIQQSNNMSFLYPRVNAILCVPTNLTGEEEKIVAKLAHKQADASVFWYIDDEYVGKTSHFHEIELSPSVGQHLLSAVDEYGEQIFRKFQVK